MNPKKRKWWPKISYRKGKRRKTVVKSEEADQNKSNNDDDQVLHGSHCIDASYAGDKLFYESENNTLTVNEEVQQSEPRNDTTKLEELVAAARELLDVSPVKSWEGLENLKHSTPNCTNPKDEGIPQLGDLADIFLQAAYIVDASCPLKIDCESTMSRSNNDDDQVLHGSHCIDASYAGDKFFYESENNTLAVNEEVQQSEPRNDTTKLEELVAAARELLDVSPVKSWEGLENLKHSTPNCTNPKDEGIPLLGGLADIFLQATDIVNASCSLKIDCESTMSSSLMASTSRESEGMSTISGFELMSSNIFGNGSFHDKVSTSECPNLMLSPLHSDISAELQTVNLTSGFGELHSSACNAGSEPSNVSVHILSNQGRDRCCGGIMNLGQSCFMSAALQVLLQVFPLKNFVLRSQHTHDRTQNCMTCSMKRLIAMHDMYSVVDPREFWTDMEVLSPALFNGRQQDAHELLQVLLNNLNKDLVSNFFGFYFRNERICGVCTETTLDIPEFTSELNLDITQSIQDSVSALHVPHEVSSSCFACGSQCKMQKSAYLDTLPKFLLITLNRFKFNGTETLKVETSTKVNKILQVGDCKYQLKGIVLHHGCTPTSGHYTSRVRWTKTNGDSTVNEIFTFYNDHTAEDSPFEDYDELTDGSVVYILLYETCETRKNNVPTEVPINSESIGAKAEADALQEAQAPHSFSPVHAEQNDSEVVLDAFENNVPSDRTPTACSPEKKIKFSKATDRAGMRGNPFQHQLSIAIGRVYEYFSEEKYEGRPLRNVRKARLRTAEALQISERMVSWTLQRLRKNSPLKTPGKKRPHRQKPKRNVDAFTRDAIRFVIYEMVRLGKRVTLSSLLKKIKERDIQFDGKVTTLRLIVHDLGFAYKKVNGRRYLMEKPIIAGLRAKFLREYIELSKKYNTVWLDETWIFRHGAMNFKAWQDVDIASCPVKTTSSGQRYIVLHAGGGNGWVKGASLVFSSKSNVADYHGEMNSANFMKWWREQLLPNLTEPTLIIMDNAPYHSIQALLQFLIILSLTWDN